LRDYTLLRRIGAFLEIPPSLGPSSAGKGVFCVQRESIGRTLLRRYYTYMHLWLLGQGLFRLRPRLRVLEWLVLANEVDIILQHTSTGPSVKIGCRHRPSFIVFTPTPQRPPSPLHHIPPCRNTMSSALPSSLQKPFDIAADPALLLIRSLSYVPMNAYFQTRLDSDYKKDHSPLAGR
jgi:hypothetical protein